MNGSEHLTENQLNDYFGNHALEAEAKHRIGRHLLQCDFCLKRLPQPTIEQFWTALMTEDDAEDSRDEGTTLAARLNSILQSLKHPKVFALSAAALAILIFFSAFIWLGAAKSFQADEVAGNFESAAQPIFSQTDGEQMNSPLAVPAVKSGDSTSPAITENKTARQKPLATNKTSKSDLKKASHNDLNETVAKTANSEKTSISSIRGGTSALPVCDGEVEMTTGTNGEAVTLKWKKVPKAAKYHLYVSDEDEILVDEYETEREVSYALKKPLDPAKTYRWKVVVTLEDGNTVIGDSQKFTLKNLESNRNKSERRKKSDVRCLQQN